MANEFYVKYTRLSTPMQIYMLVSQFERYFLLSAPLITLIYPRVCVWRSVKAAELFILRHFRLILYHFAVI